MMVIPTGHPNFLFAGTACVDFSPLNSKKKNKFATDAADLDMACSLIQKFRDAVLGKGALDKNMGQSDITFFSVLCYIDNEKPDIVILENVLSAPFHAAKNVWLKAVGYAAEYDDFDTKDYYFPQTRQRKYLVAVNTKLFGEDRATKIASQAISHLKSLHRRASTDVEKMLLTNSDKTIQLCTQQMEHEASEKKPRDVRWEHSKTRHAQVREEQSLGDSHPFSGMKKTGETAFYDRNNMVIMMKQPARVADFGDIYLLRGFVAPFPFDARFKVKIVDFSQNADRSSGTTPFGLSGCLTPNGASFITNQSRFVSGAECLILQGLPHTMTTLSLETHENLRDLAGNAMTTTVVGGMFLGVVMAMMEAGIFKTQGSVGGFQPISDPNNELVGPFTAMPSSNFLVPALVYPSFSTEAYQDATVPAILKLAAQVRRYCFCRGIQMYSSAVLWKCKICSIIRCESCKGNPPHEYEKTDIVPRAIGQEAVALKIMGYFPRVVRQAFEGLAAELVKELDQTQTQNGGAVTSASSALGSAVFYYQRVYLAETISICYGSASGFSLKATISTDGVVWFLYLDAHSDLGKAMSPLTGKQDEASRKASRLRSFLLRERPLARAELTKAADHIVPREDEWAPWDYGELYRSMKDSRAFPLTIKVTKHLGANGLDTLELAPTSPVQGFVSPKTQQILDFAYGTYKRRQQCDTAEESLYVSELQEQLFLFKDPTRTGDPKFDTFVLSHNPRIIEVYEHREILLSFVSPADVNMQLHKLPAGTYVLEVSLDGNWGETIRPQPSQGSLPASASLEKLSVAKDLQVSSHVCRDDGRLLAEAQLHREALPSHWVLSKASWISEGSKWVYIRRCEQIELFKALAPAVPDMIRSMKRLATKVPIQQPALCLECATPVPTVHWIRPQGESLYPVHKHQDIHDYEAGMRKQLPSFEVYLQLEKEGGTQKQVSVRIGFNPTRIAHRALCLLPNVQTTLQSSMASLYLSAFTEPGHSDSLVLTLKPFSNSIRGLSGDLVCDQPPFAAGRKLYKEQIPTVAWMLGREKYPEKFREREDEEEVVPGFPMRIVGRVEREVQCAGGIIADDVGFGKTVVTLAVIAHQRQHDQGGWAARDSSKTTDGVVPLKATLIIVPDHITSQWESEIRLFLGPDENLRVFTTFAALRRATLRNMQDATIILVSDKLFAEPKYWSELLRCGGMPEFQTNPGRSYCEWHQQCVYNIRNYLRMFLADSSRGARQRLVQQISDDLESRIEENKDLTAELKVKTVTRKPAKNPKSANKTTRIDPNKLLTDGVLLLELFSFARVVWDEVSYHSVEIAQFATTVLAAHKWLLSGTPPRQNLRDLDNMAKVLGLSLARPVDLRLGLPRITQGPSLSHRTRTEESDSCGKMKSDKFVKDRHEQGERFLLAFSCSNKAPVLQTKVFEHVVVCPFTIAEKAFYEYKQQTLRNAQMTLDTLSPETRGEMLAQIGHEMGQVIPDDAISKAMVFAASAPSLAPNQALSAGGLLTERRKQLDNAKTFLRRVVSHVVWLAHRLGQCTKSDPSGDRFQELTVTIRVWLNGLQDGRFEIFGGRMTYLLVLSALAPGLDLPSPELLAQASSDEGLDLIALQSNILKAKVNSGGDFMYLLDQMYKSSSSVWSDYYVVKPEDLGSLDQKNLYNLLKEYQRRRPLVQLHVPAGKDLKDLTEAELRAVLGQLITYIQSTAPPDPVPSAQFVAMLDRQTRPQLMNLCRQRGIKFMSMTRKPDLQKLIQADECGGAGAENYVGPCIRALKPTACVPRLDVKSKIRGSEAAETREDYRQVSNTVSAAVTILHDNGNHLRRAELFLKIQNGYQCACHDCGSVVNLLGVLECGHVLCQQCHGGKECCGDGTTMCPTVLRTSTVPLAQLKTGTRVLKLPGSSIVNGTPAAAAATYDCGSKITAIVDLVEQIPNQESIIIFTKYDRIIEEVMAALKKKNITNNTTTRLGAARPDTAVVLEQFKQGRFRVLVQKLDSSEAAGSNLTVANHIVFATPLVTDCQDLYETCMKQARGRCVRRGQQRDVHIYHCVTERTFEVDVLECRTRRHVRVQPGLRLGHLVAPDAPEGDLRALPWYEPARGPAQRVNSNLSTAEV